MNNKNILRRTVAVAIIIAMAMGVMPSYATERAVGENMFANPSFEDSYTGWSTPSAGISTSTAVSGAASFRTKTYYTVPPKQGHSLTAGTKYLLAYNVRTSPDPETLTETATVDYWIESNTSGAAYDVSIYEDGTELFKKSGASGGTGITGTVTSEWKLMEHVVTPTSGQASFWFGAIEWTRQEHYVHYDDMFLSELQSSGIKVTNEAGDVKGLFDGASAEFTLQANVLNQLGSPAGFEDITEFTWTSDNEKITVDNGNVTVAEDIEDGTYHITAAATVTINGVTKTEQGIFEIDVVVPVDSVFVSPVGSDSNDGSLKSPVKTLNRAKSLAREYLAVGKTNITVYLRGGTYNVSETLELDSRDSGTAASPVVWSAYNGESVTLVGGVNIPGSEFDEVTDKAILDRIADKASGSKIYSYSLSKVGITDTGYPFLKGSDSYYSVLIDLGYLEPASGAGPEVFLDDDIMTIARYPDDEYMTVGEVVTPGGDYDGVADGSPFTITVDDDRIAKWQIADSRNPILMYGFWKFEWSDQSVPLAAIDAQKGELTSAWQSTFSVKSGKPFYVYNLIEEMNTPGEYYVDRLSNTLYLNTDRDMTSIDVTMSTLSGNLISLDGADYIQLRGIDIKGVRGSAINVSNSCEGVRISDCEISYTGKRAVSIYGRDNIVSDCYIHDVNGGIGLSGGDMTTLTQAGNKALNCEIEAFSRLTQNYTAAIAVGGVGNMAAFNEIHDGPHLAISVAGQKNKIYYNNIYDVLQSCDDAGAIYGGLSWLTRGNEIKYNYIHDITNTGSGTGGGVWGIFLDGGMCATLIEGNIIADIERGEGIFVSSGRYNRVINNYGINVRNMLRMTASVNETGLNKHHYPELAWGSHDNDIWRAEFPDLFEMLNAKENNTILNEDGRVSPLYNTFKNNVVVNSEYFQGSSSSWIEADWENENYITDSDPGFVSMDTDNPDYTLDDSSEVFTKLNTFYPLPFYCMGIDGNTACMAGKGFHYEYDSDGSCTVNLCHTGDSSREAILYHAVYNEDDISRSLVSCKSQSITLANAFHSRERIQLSNGETLKAFLWTKDSLKPLTRVGTR